MDKYNYLVDFSNNKKEFSEYLENDHDGMVFELLNDYGIFIINNSQDKEEIIKFILEHTNYYDDLFYEDRFMNLFLNSDISQYYFSLNKLSFKTIKLIIDKQIELGQDDNKIMKVIYYSDEKVQLEVIRKCNLSNEIKYKLIKLCRYDIVNEIMLDPSIDLTKLTSVIGYKHLFEKFKRFNLLSYGRRITNEENVEAITIPSRMITKNLAKKIWKENNIFYIRDIINDMYYSTDPDVINKYVHEEEDKIIYSVNNGLVYPYNRIYELFKYLYIDKNVKQSLYDEYLEEYNTLVKKISINELHNTLILLDDDKEIYNYLFELSNKELSNYIIDYHFEENYYNIIIDIRELLSLQGSGNGKLSVERVNLYERILKIDKLLYNEKIELHNVLKQYNMIEIFYDDMNDARKIVSQAIKDYSISKKEMERYLDKELTLKYGVDVYNLNGENFFGLVKSQVEIMGKNDKFEMPIGNSFSLVGDGMVTVYGNTERHVTYLYDTADLNLEQVVHVFPMDSYTLYQPFSESDRATKSVNVLMMPEELVSYPYSYTEVLILQRGMKEMDFNEKIPRLKEMAIYCIDKIRDKDIKAAKAKNVGIVLVDFYNSLADVRNKNEEINRRGEYRRTTKFIDYDYFFADDDEKKYKR